MTSQDQETNIGGAAKLVGSKMFLYGQGDRLAMERDVREGLARILFNQTMYESQWTEALKRQPRSGPRMDVGRRCAVCRSGLDAESTHESWTPPKPVRSNVWIKQPEAMRRCWASGLGLCGRHLRPAHNRQRPYMTASPEVQKTAFVGHGSYLADLALEVRDHHLRRAPNGRPPFAGIRIEESPATSAERRAEIPLRLKTVPIHPVCAFA